MRIVNTCKNKNKQKNRGYGFDGLWAIISLLIIYHLKKKKRSKKMMIMTLLFCFSSCCCFCFLLSLSSCCFWAGESATDLKLLDRKEQELIPRLDVKCKEGPQKMKFQGGNRNKIALYRANTHRSRPPQTQSARWIWQDPGRVEGITHEQQTQLIDTQYI